MEPASVPIQAREQLRLEALQLRHGRLLLAHTRCCYRSVECLAWLEFALSLSRSRSRAEGAIIQRSWGPMGVCSENILHCNLAPRQAVHICARMVDDRGGIHDTVKEVVWQVHHLETGLERSQFAVIEPEIKEYSLSQAPSYLLPLRQARDWMPMSVSLCLGLSVLAAVAGLLAVAVSKLVTRIRLPPATLKQGDPSDPVVLYDFPRAPVVPGPASSLSPFVSRVEAFMRFVGIPYAKRVGVPPRAPKGQLPFIQHGPNTVAESGFIIDYLAATFGEGPQGMRYPPDPQNKATAVVIERMAAGILAYAIGYFRVVSSENWSVNQHVFVAGYRLPWLVELVLRRLGRQTIVTKAMKAGFGRLSEEDILTLVDERLGGLAALLGNQTFLFGDQPYGADAAIFGVLDQYVHGGMNPQLKEAAHKWPTLVAYVDRMRCRYFGPDYVQSVVWLNDRSTAGFAKVKEKARAAECARYSPARLSARRRQAAASPEAWSEEASQGGEAGSASLFS